MPYTGVTRQARAVMGCAADSCVLTNLARIMVKCMAEVGNISDGGRDNTGNGGAVPQLWGEGSDIIRIEGERDCERAQQHRYSCIGRGGF